MSKNSAPGGEERSALTEVEDELGLLREAAKQLISLTAVLPTFYFAALSFSDLHKSVRGLEALPFLFPALPWLFSQVLLIQIVLPHQAPAETAAARLARLEGLARRYSARLRWGYWCVLAGLILLLLGLGYYLMFVPAPS